MMGSDCYIRQEQCIVNNRITAITVIHLSWWVADDLCSYGILNSVFLIVLTQN